MRPTSTLEKVAGLSYEQYTKATLPKDYLTVCVMGTTGVGKSSFLSFLARPEGPPVFESSRSLAAHTQVTSEYHYEHESFLWLSQDQVNSYPIRLVDAPGLNDTQDRGIDLQHVSNLIDEVKKHKKIDTLIFVVKLTDRFDAQYMQTLRYCCNDLFGNVPEHFVKVVFTYLDSDMYEEYQDDEGGEQAYLEKLDEIYSFFSPHLGNKTIKCYFINTAKKNPKRTNAALEKYYEFCRNSSTLTPGLESIFEFQFEDVDVYSLYVRDKVRKVARLFQTNLPVDHTRHLHRQHRLQLGKVDRESSPKRY
jgi:GTP-binding protein EngB required for normal cell division